jgi:hypothetical protein
LGQERGASQGYTGGILTNLIYAVLKYFGEKFGMEKEYAKNVRIRDRWAISGADVGGVDS